MKNKFKNYGFWVSLSSAVVVLFEAIGRACGFIPDGQIINDIIMSVAGLLVVLGFVTMPASEKNKTDETKTNNEETKEAENAETENTNAEEGNDEATKDE